MISVADALNRLLALATPLPPEQIPLAQSGGRVLAEDAVSSRAQPSFAASAMDGYATAGEIAVGQTLTVIGTARAGARYAGRVEPGKAVRIFTGSPVPEGADRVIIQEDVALEGDHITLLPHLDFSRNIRPAGADFAAGHRLLAGQKLRPADVALLAAMNVAKPVVFRQPVVAIIATGDELVLPGEEPGKDQILTSNSYGLKALAEAEGARVRLMPIARDNREALRDVIGLAEGADVVLTIGGASVGDHDLVATVAGELGMEKAFHKVAMRPGKPVMSGRLGTAIFLGLPGNPVSAMVCGHLFLAPLLRKLQGLTDAEPKLQRARLTEPLPENGPRAHYMRASLTFSEELPQITAMPSQDSGLLSPLASADVLLLRPPHAPPAHAGALVDYIAL